jgi:hypothetical protein
MILFVASFRMVATKENKIQLEVANTILPFAFQTHHRPPSKGVHGEEESQKHTR